MPVATLKFINKGAGKKYYNASDAELLKLGRHVREIVADALSTSGRFLSSADVDWIPLALPEGSLAADVAIEIEAIGYPGRKQKMTLDRTIELKLALLTVIERPDIPESDPFLWIRYVDPDGCHV